MNLKFIVVFISLLGLISLSTCIKTRENNHLLESSEDPYVPYHTVYGCSMNGINSSFILSENNTAPQKPTTPLTPNTCQQTHPEYSQMACCDAAQTQILQNNLYLAQPIFGRCPSCFYNVYDLWCASSCSPYQSSFMIITSTQPVLYNNTDQQQIISATYVLHPDYASGVYNSCRDVSTGGSQPLGAMYKTPLDFFNGIFGINPAFQLTFVFDVNGYNNEVAGCAESCSCDNCREACFPVEGIEQLEQMLNDTLPQTYLFNHQLPTMTVYIIMSYVLFLLVTLLGYNVFLIFRHDVRLPSGFHSVIQNRFGKVLFVAVLSIVVTVAVIFMLTATARPTSTENSECKWKMPFNREWNCSLALSMVIYVSIALFFLFSCLFILNLFDRSRDHLPPSQRPIPGYSSMISVFDVSLVSSSSSDQSSPVLQGLSGGKDSTFIQKFFYWYGLKVANNPYKIMLGCLVFTALASLGCIMLQIEQDPVKLWVTADSRAALEKQYFDENFGPFYRIEQLIITAKDPVMYPSVINMTLLQALFELEIELMSLTAQYDGNNVTLQDLCFEPTRKGCLVESVSGLWQRNLQTLENGNKGNVTAYYLSCTAKLLSPDCMDSVGAPVNPSVVLGGWTNQSVNATAFVTTFLLRNEPSMQNTAMAWEQVWLDTVKTYADASTLFNVAYSAERSVQDELSRESSADVPTILISYTVMLVYISFALGRFYPFPNRWLSLFVNSRFALGLYGIFIVICSLAISVGLCSLMQIKATLIISEVIPFLVLAIGVDNIFILVNTFESLHVSRYDVNTKTTLIPTPEDSLARSMAKVGPSIALGSLSESLAFLLGSLTRMPAVQAFSFYASLAILFDFLLQMSAFASFLIVDAKRAESRRIDCIPCIKLNDGENSDDEEAEKGAFECTRSRQ
ncbi:Niemann-Pick C type protein [Tieghemostelium lacteum]|uniref:Niemann-Pick C type protein n=1 Tax=Tieghemostelium lacteum TaxID=361077 RepID=A0A152A487_TIELA|nr:Niemann-Pick C type protein [Tieghemostelium lacteum]|eukprot:KYR01019.1 Niemann-Pick C type protein [Tieghemostelium lacteum]